ncbi:macro domain-containing protein [Shewanella indica]|uniref:macro domain-containing protein n=1 Tax=Shewanella indica TaxID=768528 RepID=UPI001F24F837|nr:macro domain-containing protein [Shewanella indica]
MKVKFLDKMVLKDFLEKVSIISAFFTIVFIFVDIPDKYKSCAGITAGLIFVFIYLGLWLKANRLRKVNLHIEGSKVVVKAGDIFKQSGLKAIAFNEYFDTQVDDKIISKKSLNGIFIEQHSNKSQSEIDDVIDSYQFEDDDLIEDAVERSGKSRKYKLGTVCILDDYLMVAFSKFDKQNRAVLTMPEYLEFLINFWDNVNRVYSQKDVSVPIFGTGITRIKEHKNISDENLLKIMLWTFRISEMRFNYPAKLTIVVHEDKMDSINLFDIKTAENGI